MNRSTNDPAPSVNQGNSTATKHVVVGALIGLAWGSSLRAWMALLAFQLGDLPKVTWQGTIAGILLPAMAVGALDGHAVYAAKTSEQKRWRWVILSPSLLILGPAIVQDHFISNLLKTGMGGGAIGVALVGMLGGYALSGFGPRWTRRVAALLALLFLIASIAPVYFADPSSDRPPGANEVFIIFVFVLLMAQLVAGIGAPSRVQSSRYATR
jgi:peptidoglycan/LPS O-acetylase OafA/YrhL